MMKGSHVSFGFIVCWIALCFASCDVTTDSRPIIAHETITFSNGRSVSYSPKVIVYQNADEAVRLKEPVSIEEKASLIKAWDRVLLERISNYFEDKTKVITIYDFRGNVLSVTHPFFGEAIILQRKKRILILQKSVHHQVGESRILDSNGQNIATVKHSPNVMSFGQSADDLTWWVMTSGIEAGHPFIETFVYDFNGSKIGQFKKFSKAMISYSYNAMTYTIQSPQPQMPG